MWITSEDKDKKIYLLNDEEYERFKHNEPHSLINIKCGDEYLESEINVDLKGYRYIIINDERYYLDYFKHYNASKELEKIKMLKSIIIESEKILRQIKATDDFFDSEQKIEVWLNRIESMLNKYDGVKMFDFRNLKFDGYKLVDDIKTSEKDTWFEMKDNGDNSIHVYVPEFVNIDNVSSDDYKYIVVVEILQDCQHYKTLVLDAKTWIADTENLGAERNYEDMSKYILAWAFKEEK